jgi:hypothetical protein
MAIDFILATQPKVWERLKQHHGSEVKERFLKRLSSEIERRGTLDVLRNGIKDSVASMLCSKLLSEISTILVSRRLVGDAL